MRKRSRWCWFLALGCVAIVGVAGALWFWVVPTWIVAEIRKHHQGHVTIRGWWIGGSSAGVTGLTLHETPSADSPVWATTERVTTDLSIGVLLRGRFTPRWIHFQAPRVRYRITEDGRPRTRIPLRRSKNGPTPVLIAEQGWLTLAQAGRPEMVVSALKGRLDPDAGGAGFQLRSVDAAWGKPAVVGRFGPGFESVRLRLTADPLPADPHKVERIPFVTEQVWNYFVPTGPVRVVLDYARPKARSEPSLVQTVVNFEGSRVVLPHLRLTARDTDGRLFYQDEVVRFDRMQGEMVGGRVAVSGSMDFHGRESRYALNVDVDDADLGSLPDSWGLDTVGLDGRLTGTARLLMRLAGRGLDLTGSTGRGTVEEASVRGLPLGRLGWKFRGEGLRSVANASDTRAGVFLPQWLGSDFEVRHVELKQAIARIGSGATLNKVPVSGRLDLRLALRMPLGTQHDLRAYRGEGTADLAGATIGSLRLGRLAARLGLSSGILDVAGVRGRLVERSDHDTSRPVATEPPPLTGPLPAGGFRGRFRTDLVTDGHAEAAFEGRQLPLSALASSVAGTLTVQASARGASLSDPQSWAGSGRIEGPEVAVRSARFREVSATLALKRGRLSLANLVASLDDHPLSGQGMVELAAPHTFQARLGTVDLPLADLLALVPSSPAKRLVSGTVAVQAEASGTLAPWRVESRGRARIEEAEVDRVPIGDLPIAWKTNGENVVVTAREIQRYRGRLSAEVRVPIRGDRPIEGTLTLSRVDTAQLAAEVPGSLRLTGRADGRARFRLPIDGDDPPAKAEARLTATRMTVEGIPARTLWATIDVHRGVSRFEAHAEGLDGAFVVKGTRESSRAGGGARVEADVKALGFQLSALREALATSGFSADIHGLGAIAAHVRSRGSGGSLLAQGAAEVRDLRWGEAYPVGHLRAGFAVSPNCWRVGHLKGSLWGSPIRGELWRQTDGHEPARYGLTLRLERASLSRIFAFEPELEQRFEGFASLWAEGRSEETFRGRGEFRIERGRVNHLPIVGLSIPVDWDLRPEEDFQGTIRVRKAHARLAGGRLQGEATVRLGLRRDIHAELALAQIDMRAINRAESRAGRPVPGTIDGIITLDSPDLARLQDYTGKAELVLTRAALVDIPILDGIDRALGSARGAVFDEGAFHAQIAQQEIRVERLTLVGPLAQLHASGTVGFDGRLNLLAFVNTIDTVPANAQIAIGRFSNAVDDVRLEGRSIDRVADLLSSRLMKFRISGTLAHPSYSIDGSIHVDKVVLAFFVEAMRLARSGALR